MAKRWYSISVRSNFEKSVSEQINTAVDQHGLRDEIEQVLVPTQEYIEIRRGKQDEGNFSEHIHGNNLLIQETHNVYGNERMNGNSRHRAPARDG